MQEEYHGIDHGSSHTFKQLYGWGTLNTKVWLPSVSELVGYNPNTYDDLRGTYFSAMQGMNTSNYWHVDAKGGNQFAYFKQFNASGGGQKLWNACNQESTWTRSSKYAEDYSAWIIQNPTYFHTPLATYSYAVHSAEDTGSNSHFGYTLLKIKEIPREAGDEDRARGVPWDSQC